MINLLGRIIGSGLRNQKQNFPAPKLQAPKPTPVAQPKATPLATTPATSTELRPMPAVRGALAFGNIAYPGFKPKAQQKMNPLLQKQNIPQAPVGF